MVFAEEIRKTILRLAEERGPGQSFDLSDVAKAIDENNWHELIEQVKLVSGILVREGKIIARNSNGSFNSELLKAPASHR